MANENQPHEWLDKVQQINFDRLDMLVSERIGMLKLYVSNMDKVQEDKAVHDAICRDLVFPCIALLTNFIESVNFEESAGNGADRG